MTVHIMIRGKVQGVFFRASAKEKADALQIVGWVKNLPDRSVAIVAHGSAESIRIFIEWCHEGPRGASVSEVVVTEEAEEIKFQRFVIAT
ncbi:MAG: acylphosphatase [Bacteroidetes bacterium]|nr:acylphosphatase [Bacteroidota bacterium]